jgi:hypothetical protein
MLTARVRNLGFAHTHSENCCPSPKHVSHKKFAQMHVIFVFETRSGGLELCSTAGLLSASTDSAAKLQISRHTII